MTNDQIALCCALIILIPQLICMYFGIRMVYIEREFKKRMSFGTSGFHNISNKIDTKLDNVLCSKCKDCNKLYDDFTLDTVLSDEQWAIINPDINGLLCAQCIVNRSEKEGAIFVKLELKFKSEGNRINAEKI